MRKRRSEPRGADPSEPPVLDVVKCKRDARPCIADAEKASRSSPALLQRHKATLLGPLADQEQQEVKWHLLQMLPRLDLTEVERNSALMLAERALAHHSRIVQAEALAALFALSLSNAKLHGRAVAAAEQALRSGSPALRARARKLLRKPEVRHVRSR